MNEQINKDRNYISRMLKLLEGSNLTIAHNILAAQKRVTQYEERLRATQLVTIIERARVVELLKPLIHVERGFTRASDGLISWAENNRKIEAIIKEILSDNN